MAKGPGPALLLAGAAALFLMSKKGGGKGDGKKDDFEPNLNEDKKKPEKGAPTAPTAKTQEELEKEMEPDPGDTAPTPDEVVAQAKWKVWPPGSEPHGSLSAHNWLYAGEDCESALIGRDWKPIIESDGKLYDPASFWVEFGEGESPMKKVEQIGASQVNWFTRRLFESKNALILCEGEIPNPQDYSTEEDFDNAWTALLNGSPGLAKLFYEVYDEHVKYAMLGAWAEADPDGFTDWQIGEVAEWAVQNHPQEDVTEQTDQAYFYWIEDEPDAPKVLDPGNPAHAEYIELWLALNEAIKDL